MKNFLILNFTEILFELTASGLSLRKALLIMEENFGSAKQDKKISAICRFVGNSLDDGNEFSLALASCSFFNFPEWYVAFVSVTERTGSIVPTLDYLTDVIRRRKINMEKFLSSLVYPVFVVIFSTIVGIFAIYSFDSVIFEKTELEIQNNAAIDSVFFSFVFLITSFSGFIFFMKKNLKESPCMPLTDLYGPPWSARQETP